MAVFLDTQWWMLCGAFWVVAAAFRREDALRGVVGLVACALAAHAGWMLLHADHLAALPFDFDPTRGFCVLFIPLGPLAVAASIREPGSRGEYLASIASVLPLGLLVARLGCVFGGCCGGRLEGDDVIHPTALYEALGWGLGHVLIRRLRPDDRFACLCVLLGTLRLIVEPLRAPPPLGAPWFPIEVVAGGVAMGGLVQLGLRRWRVAHGRQSRRVAVDPNRVRL